VDKKIMNKKFEIVADDKATGPIAKPDNADKFDLSRFKSEPASEASVDTLTDELPHHSVAQAKDFVRLHPDEAYWSDEWCFVNVPIKGEKRKQLHMIDRELARAFVAEGSIQRFRLVLATKPLDVFFLAHVPTRNLDNSYNSSNRAGCERAKTTWVQLTRQREDNKETYKITAARDHDAFPEPKWPTQSLDELIVRTFAGCLIDREDHPALLRLIGAKQKLA
jgi:hypothetical protein